MSEEGEFKKRINDLANSYFEIVLTVPEEDMKKMVDEAKREFPTPDTNSSHGYWQYANQVKEWFNKWFGGESTK